VKRDLAGAENREFAGVLERGGWSLKSAGIIWNDDTLDEWIKDPQHFIPENTMTFPGMKEARQRADLLAFLKEATQPAARPKPRKTPARLAA
jgi:cytochrome c